MKQVLATAVLAAALVAGQYQHQQPLSGDLGSTSRSYKFEWPVKKVAVIGAGVGGLISYRELTQQGFEVDLYERDSVAGGNWHYTEEAPLDAPIPNAPIAVGDYEPSLPREGVTFPYTREWEADEKTAAFYRRAHRGPKPIWASLKSNAPAPVQQIRETPWPKGTEWELPHEKLSRYIRAFASWHGVNSNDGNPHAFYNTRVEHVERSTTGWTLIAKELVSTSTNTTRATWYKRHYDAVVVATGRYNAPNIPNIDGLKEWNKEFSGKLQHSRQYRRPESYAGKTVLIIGAATSGGEIARELVRYAKKVYVSARRDSVEERDCYLWHREHYLRNGIPLYVPFLPQYINQSLGTNGTLPREEGITQPIVTDGTHLRSLYLDAFYIPDPTLLTSSTQRVGSSSRQRLGGNSERLRNSDKVARGDLR
ncbi:hypothetical protein NMY22_g11343 [Coprinellus aureogranulatus]|nr:hypothetical protein NMY22_g11343 [Coprinellus aureogranulatus]